MAVAVLADFLPMGRAARMVGLSRNRLAQILDAQQIAYAVDPQGNRWVRKSDVERLIRARAERPPVRGQQWRL